MSHLTQDRSLVVRRCGMSHWNWESDTHRNGLFYTSVDHLLTALFNSNPQEISFRTPTSNNQALRDRDGWIRYGTLEKVRGTWDRFLFHRLAGDDLRIELCKAISRFLPDNANAIWEIWARAI